MRLDPGPNDQNGSKRADDFHYFLLFLFEAGLSGTTRFVERGRSVHLEQAASTPDGYIPLTTDRVDELALPDRPHSFRRMTSCNVSRSNDSSATSFFSLAFSSSSCFSRRISSGSSPSYFFLQLK